MTRGFGFALAAAAALAMSACAPGDVELNGKLFDMVGVGTGSQSTKAPKLAERAPLVVPPSLDRLPPPETASVAANDASFPVDPEQRGSQSQDELKRRQAAYCKENYDKAIALGDETKANSARGPLGLCSPSALQAVTGTNPLVQRQ